MSDTSDDDDTPNKSQSWLEKLTNLIVREPKNRDQLFELLDDAKERGVVNDEMLKMIKSIIQVSETRVRQIMRPKKSMIVLTENMSLEELLSVIIDSGHSRLPIMDADQQQVIGMLLAKDLLKFFHEHNEDDFQIKNFIRPAIFIPQSKRLNTLLKEFRINHNHIAIVVDEYGHVTGLVTMEDVLEQIVGDIEDEYDVED